MKLAQFEFTKALTQQREFAVASILKLTTNTASISSIIIAQKTRSDHKKATFRNLA